MATQNDFVKGLNKNQAGFARSRNSKKVYKYSDTSLMNYFRYIGNRKSLTAAEETAAAENIFQLEHEFWQTILSNPNAVQIVDDAWEGGRFARSKQEESVAAKARGLVVDLLRDQKGGKGKKRANSQNDETLTRIAHELYLLDEDRELVASASRAVAEMKVDGNSDDLDAYEKSVKRVVRQIREAKNLFIQENLGLVVNIAKRYHVEKMPLADLIQEGNLGLIRAVDKFDYAKGFRFSTYASWWIRSYISRAIVRKSNTVRIPEYMLRDRNRIKRSEEASRVRNGHAPDEEELANELGLSKKRLSRTRKHDVAFVESLDREMPGSDNQRYIDFLSDEDAKGPLENVEFNAWVRDIPKNLSKLSVTERFVICWRFGLLDGEEMTLQEIGKCLNLSRERIRQIQEEALVKLRTRLEVDAA